MLKANELRIGNYVKYESFKKPIQVSVIDTTETNIVTTAKPIQLTEKWLLKFGFNEKMFGWWSSVLFLRVDKIDKSFWFDWAGTMETKCINIKYVHQLQNLYFALTGEELFLIE